MSAPTSQSSYIPRPRSSNPGVRPSAALTYTTAPSARTPRHHHHHHHNNGQQQPRPGDGGLPPRSGGGGGSDGGSLGPRRDFNNSARSNGGLNAGTANSSSLQASSSSSPGDLLSPSSPSSASGSSLSHSQQHPQFRGKMVCTLSCRHCANQVCSRGMKAILLGDLRVELYSTDSPPSK
ncbi:Protein fam72a [Geranomyces variabilis]|nr:Protein fam72a [Geranomyces variabilis]